MRKKVAWFLSALMLVALVMCIGSCERAFPDDRLDYYWRLDRIKYKGGETCEALLVNMMNAIKLCLVLPI